MTSAVTYDKAIWSKYRTGSFSSHLFWDIDSSKLDPAEHVYFLVQRVLEYGVWEDWLALLRLYSLATIAAIATNLRSLEPKALHFIAAVSHTPLSAFRCYTSKPSMPAHSRYYSD